MPRVADRSAREEQISDAVLRLVGRGGVGTVTMAAVAREAGVSVGLIQHYFRSKRDLLLLAHRRMTSRFDTWLDEQPAEPTAGEEIRRALLQMLPLDERRAAEMRIRIAFGAEAAFDSEIAAIQTARQRLQRQRLEGALRSARDLGELPADLDPGATALELGAFLGGLGQQMIVDPARIDPATARAALEHALRRLFPELRADA